MQKIVEAVRLAKQRLAPARVGYGTGVSYINVNRQIIDPKTGTMVGGPKPRGAIGQDGGRGEVRDRRAVSRSPSTTTTPCTRVITGQLDQVSGDIPGATSRYIEDSFDDKVVAVWSNGAAGDQNPIYYQQTYDLRDIRIKDYARRGIDISNAMPPGGKGSTGTIRPSRG